MSTASSCVSQPLAIFEENLFVYFPLLLRRFFLFVKKVLKVLYVILFLLVFAINKSKLLLEPLFFQLMLHMQLLYIFNFFAQLKREIVFQCCGIISEQKELLRISLFQFLLDKSDHLFEFAFLSL